MPNQTLEKIKLMVLRGDCILSSHVLDKVEENYFTDNDVEASIVNGVSIEKGKDELGQAVDGNKYTITSKDQCETVGKLLESDEGQIYFVITAYRRTRS